MEIQINEQINEAKWEDFFSENPYATPFQSRSFYDLFNSVKGLSAIAIAITRTDSILALVVITIQKESGVKGCFSRRAIIYGGPLIDPEHPEALNPLLKQIYKTTYQNTIYIETRNLSDYSKFKTIFSQYGWDYLPYFNFHLKTSDFESILKNISGSRLRQIKKALKSGVNWGETKNPEEIVTFYNILGNLYKQKIKKPLLPFEFFIKMFEADFSKLLLVRKENEIIGGIVCPVLKGKAIYEFYICGMDNSYKDQYPSIMATWAGIEYACQNNIPLFDFMGAGTPNEEYGVRDFKARFGCELIEYGRFIKIYKPLLFKIGKLGLKLMNY